MMPEKFKEANVIIAKDQPEYLPLPACVHGDSYGTITTCWRLTFWERLRLLVTGRVWLQQLTFYQKLQPQLPHAKKPDLSDLPYDE